jgi:hypothetical protein
MEIKGRKNGGREVVSSVMRTRTFEGPQVLKGLKKMTGSSEGFTFYLFDP